MNPSTYADAFGILGSLTDLKVDFFSVSPHIENGQVVGEERTAEQRIILSLPLAKELAMKLQGAVEEYEKNFGKVLDLDEVKKRIASQNTNG